MAQTLSGWMANQAICIRPHAVRVTVHVWRRVAGVPQWLYTYAGPVDGVALRAILQQVEQLAGAVPGRWRIEVLASGLEGALLYDVIVALRALQRTGLQPRLALARRQRGVRATRARASLGAMPSTLRH